jgi:hypothetical protein
VPDEVIREPFEQRDAQAITSVKAKNLTAGQVFALALEITVGDHVASAAPGTASRRGVAPVATRSLS